jgi:hypothetical protein
MSTFSDLNLNITNLSDKSIEQLVEHAIKCKFIKKTSAHFLIKIILFLP